MREHRRPHPHKSTTRRITVDGVSDTICGWARRLGISEATIRERLRRGWSEREAVTTPSQNARKVRRVYHRE